MPAGYKLGHSRVCKCLSTEQRWVRHLHDNKIATYELFFASVLYIFLILPMQLFEYLAACQLIKKTLLCYSYDNSLPLPRLVSHKISSWDLFPRWSQTAIFVSCIEAVFSWAISGNFADNKITWRRHQMEIFSPLLALCVGHSPVT